MKEKPILFSGPMVRAILEGRKWQTRRVVKLPRVKGLEFRFDGARVDGGVSSPFYAGQYLHLQFRCLADGADGWGMDTWDRVFCPIALPGDRLWVREAWGKTFEPRRFGNLVATNSEGTLRYRADYVPDGEVVAPVPEKWRPSIFMPRWASRITLEVTGVRVERLQEISRQDAKAEGLWPSPHNGLEMVNGRPYGNAQLAFRALWESINGECSWDANPWVWVIEFQTWEVRG